jgi:hypothetical protein
LLQDLNFATNRIQPDYLNGLHGFKQHNFLFPAHRGAAATLAFFEGKFTMAWLAHTLDFLFDYYLFGSIKDIKFIVIK